MLPDKVYLASYKGPADSFLHKVTHTAIKTVTHSPFSHCEIVINGIGYSSSERDGGVRAKEIDFADGKWEIRPMPWVPALSVLSFFQDTKDDGYDFWGLRLFLNLQGDPTEDTPQKWWCSEWCAAAIGLFDTRVAPGTLDRWAQARYVDWVEEQYRVS